MKSRILTTFMTLLIALSITACGNRPSNESADQSGTKTKMDSLVQTDVTPEQPANEDATTQQVPKKDDTAKQISKDEAAQIAIKHAGFTADQVSRLHTDLDLENGRYQYEVEFDQGSFEYEYEIDAQTGKVLFFDKDADRD